MFSMKRAIKQAILTDSGKSWPTFDGGTLKRFDFVSASESTRCVRQLAFQKIAEKAKVPDPDFWDRMSDEEFAARVDGLRDDDMLGIFERGNQIEEWAVKRLMDYQADGDDIEFLFVGTDQRSFYTKKRRVSGTPDGLYLDHVNKVWHVLEFKSTQNPISAPKPANAAQLLTNMGLIKHLIDEGNLDQILDLPLSSYQMGPGILLYIGTDNYLDMAEFYLDYDGGEAYMKACGKARALFAVDQGKLSIRAPETLPPEGIDQWGGCYFCPFKAECQKIEEDKRHAANAAKIMGAINKLTGRADLPKMPEFKSFSRQQVLAAMAKYQQASDSEKAAKLVKTELKPLLTNFVKEEGPLKKFQDGDDVFTASYSEFEREGSFDKEKVEEALKEAGFDPADFKKPSSQQSRLTVKVVPEYAYLRRDLAKAFESEEEGDEE